MIDEMKRCLILILFILMALPAFSQVSQAKKSRAASRDMQDTRHEKLIDSANFYKKKDIGKSLGFIS